MTIDFTKEKVDSDLPLIFHSRFDIKLLKSYTKESFCPVPKVNSSLIKLKPRDLLDLKDDFFLIAYLFKHKNSKLKNALREGLMTSFQIVKINFYKKNK